VIIHTRRPATLHSPKRIGRTASLFFKLNRLETTSRHRSQKGIESDINRNCQQNAKKEFPGNEPAEKNGRRVEKKKHKKCLSRTKGNGNSKKDSPVQSSRSLNWGWNLAFVEKRFFQEATGSATLKRHSPVPRYVRISEPGKSISFKRRFFQEATGNAMHSRKKQFPGSKQTISEPRKLQ
jgi:hypothetical protein